jgi:hypothetical protein
MKTAFSTKAILVLAATALLGTVSILAQTSGAQKTLTGVVSDAMCGQTHMMKDKPEVRTGICRSGPSIVLRYDYVHFSGFAHDPVQVRSAFSTFPPYRRHGLHQQRPSFPHP